MTVVLAAALLTLAGCGGNKSKPAADPPTPVPASASKSAPATKSALETPSPAKRPKDWVGVWHSCPEMGSGWCAAYVLFADGKFRWLTSSMGCQPGLQQRSGTWRVDGAALVLDESSREVLVGGTCKSGDMVGGTTKKVVHPEAKSERLAVGECAKPHEMELPCHTIAGKDHWRFREDPGDFP